MIIEYENPIKRMAEEFVPHVKLLAAALRSLIAIYPRRNLPAQQWR